MLSKVTGKKTRFPLRSTPRGFALVMTLVLMSLLLILVLAMAALIRNETPSITAQMNLAEARHHALAGLQIAMGELQTAAGPDQRISARADLLDSSAGTPEIDGVNQPYWTGAWTTGNDFLDVGPSPQRTTSLGALDPTQAEKSASATWLVSQDPNGATPSPIDFTGGQVMARDWGTNEVDVEVPLIDIIDDQGTPATTDDVTLGAYAYWVSDEGVKARADLVDTDFDSSSLTRSQQQLRRWSPGANAMQEIFPLSTGVDDFRESDPGDVAKLSLPGQVALLPDVDRDALELKEALPDFTVHSSGVLADVRNGGLKKDLTAAFEDEDNFQQFAWDNGKGNAMLFRTSQDSYCPLMNQSFPDLPLVLGRIRTEDRDGMIWDSFFYYYNLYKASSPAAESTTATVTGIGDPDASLPYSISTRSYAMHFPNAYQQPETPTDLWVPTDIRILDFLPQIVAHRIEAAVSSYFDGTNWKLRIHYYPQLVLYNPYSVRLELNDFSFTRVLRIWSTEFHGNRKVRVTIGSNSGEFKLALRDVKLRTAPGETDVLEPGETRVYALDANTQVASMNDSTAMDFEMTSHPGTSADFYQYTDFAETLTTPNGTDLVTIESVVDTTKITEDWIEFQGNNVSFPRNITQAYYTEDERNKSAGGEWTPLPIESIGPNPIYLRGIFIRKKGLRPSGNEETFNNAVSAIPLFLGNSNHEYGVIYTTPLSKEVASTALGDPYLSGFTDLQIQPAINGRSWETSWGAESTGIVAPGTRPVLVDLPSAPMSSLGQFTHYNWNHLAIGGSYSSCRLYTNTVATNMKPSASYVSLSTDTSFLANQELFDRFFLSTVPPEGSAPSGTTWPAAWTNFNTANSGTTLTDPSLPLLNQRLNPRDDKVVQLSELRDPYTAAANLMLEGAFNVNSTSVPAWKAFLKTHSNNPIELYHASGSSPGAVTIDPGDDVLISRFWSATGASSPNQPWSGVRTLDDDDITDLAENIVEQVKLRGPFLSMGDFLNRRQGPNNPLSRSGALQAAIDKTDINDDIRNDGVDIVASPEDNWVGEWSNNADYNYCRDSEGNLLTTSAGMPGYLMQQDLVMQYVPAMTARSDTFVIRCYGDTRNKLNGSIEARAWGEAVVQRIPEYVDDADAPEVAPADLTSTANQNFGRRYVIKEFRWLNQDEI